MLPEQFLARMKCILGEEYQGFLDSSEKPPWQSLRINRLKGGGEPERKLKAFMDMEPVPWNGDGYYYKEEARPGKHPFHEAGVYYIQEASAMLPAVYLDAKPGEIVLDLCAAPGGKSTQIAAAMGGRGLLVCNEIHPGRAKILSENIERMGICNAVVTSHEPAVLAERFPGYFDKILVDAPCSGEGMFRKNGEAAFQWSPENVTMCAKRQKSILESAASMLKDGGRIVYSTCTFSTEENEENIGWFLERHPEFSVEEPGERPGPGNNPGIMPGLTVFGNAGVKGIENTVRLWPHKVKGEGHFLASLKKQGEGGLSCSGGERGLPEKDCTLWLEFQKRYLRTDLHGIYISFGSQLYLLPEEAPSLKGLKVLRPGLHLGTMKKDRFEPAHALALAIRAEDAVLRYDLSAAEAAKYIAGYALPVSALEHTQQSGRAMPAKNASTQKEKGWYLITVEGYSLGWGKLSGGIMKNHYPKGLRK